METPVLADRAHEKCFIRTIYKILLIHKTLDWYLLLSSFQTKIKRSKNFLQELLPLPDLKGYDEFGIRLGNGDSDDRPSNIPD